MNSLREFARSDASSSTEISSISGYSKDGKSIDTPVEHRITHRWGVWGMGSGYFDGRNVSGASVGVDYRIKDHWLIGAYAQWWYNHQSVLSGGLYTALYSHGWWLVVGGQAGVNNYSLYGSAGYDFRLGNWLIGPVVSVQYDDYPVDLGFGTGNLFQTRAGFRVAYDLVRFRPFAQVMWQGQTLDYHNGHQNGIWFDVGASYAITDRWSVFGDWNFEGSSNSGYQIYQVNLGLRTQF